MKFIRKVLYKGISLIPKKIRQMLFVGKSRYCPICGSYVSFFMKSIVHPRPNARCPICGSFERHRMDWLFLKKYTNLWDNSPKRLLHVAPEPMFEQAFRKMKTIDYLSGDLSNRRAMVKMDITNIQQYPNDFFDVIYCSHVLEHVPDDRKAMRELFRVLKLGGFYGFHHFFVF